MTRRGLGILLCLLGLLLVIVLALVSPWPAPFAGVPWIEDKVTERAVDRLAGLGVQGAAVSADGQDVLIEVPRTGIPDGVALEDLVAAVREDSGVRDIELIELVEDDPQATPDPGESAAAGDTSDAPAEQTEQATDDGAEQAAGPTPEPPEPTPEPDDDPATSGPAIASIDPTTADLAMRWSGDSVELFGTVVDEPARSALIRAAEVAGGSGATVDNLQVMVDAPSQFDTVTAGAAILRRIDEWYTDATIAVQGEQLTVDGTARSAEDLRRAETIIAEIASRAGLTASIGGTVGAAPEGPGSDAASVSALVNSLDLSNVTFEVGTAQLTAESLDVLAGIAAQLSGLPPVPIEVRGHTDSAGDPDVNLLLSIDRAQAVRDQLVELGVPGSSLTAQGLGSAEPIADNATPEGQALNRRVELVVIEGN